MNQEEVDLIYEYLHENYEYYEGDFIRKYNSRGRKKGSKLIGQINYTDIQKISLCVSIPKLNIANIPYAKLVYIYHTKVYPKYLKFNDSNSMNCAFENLTKLSRQPKDCINFSEVKTKSGIRYRISFYLNGKGISLGQPKNKEIAIKIYQTAVELMNEGVNTEIELKTKIKQLFPDEKIIIGNSTGFTGVIPSEKRFRAEITINRKSKHLGMFDTPHEAHEAYLKAKEELKK